MRFFIDEKLPGVNMMGIRSAGWEFISKAIEVIDANLGIKYISTPMPLLWRVIRESYNCGMHAMKLMTSRLLKVACL